MALALRGVIHKFIHKPSRDWSRHVTPRRLLVPVSAAHFSLVLFSLVFKAGFARLASFVMKSTCTDTHKCINEWKIGSIEKSGRLRLEYKIWSVSFSAFYLLSWLYIPFLAVLVLHPTWDSFTLSCTKFCTIRVVGLYIYLYRDEPRELANELTSGYFHNFLQSLMITSAVIHLSLLQLKTGSIGHRICSEEFRCKIQSGFKYLL